MMCSMEPMVAVLPAAIRKQWKPEMLPSLQEIRLRRGCQTELNYGSYQRWLSHQPTHEDLNFVINAASKYSPWAASGVRRGYLTISGGHRIGICGEVTLEDQQVKGLHRLESLCIRVARDIPGLGRSLQNLTGSTLILGAPGWGKTTLLRDLCRLISQKHKVFVADERSELFPDGFQRGPRMDVMQNCPKALAIPMALRTMGPEWIAVDEITEAADTAALLEAAGCGVNLLATAHAQSEQDMKRRKIYVPLLEMGLFENFIYLNKDQTWHLERRAS
ncbi:MAG: Flp pilus assembly complex ATPase component TadA [Oscillospiraceae bacterium]|nr:Flp pilus assembly complex ATPase component TadA [Oscillospiraceae bacterium]